MNNNPKITFKKDRLFWYYYILTFIIVVVNFIYPAIHYSNLPDLIPIHYNFSGQVDRLGEKNSIWFLPILNLVCFLGLTFIAKKPYLYNYGEKITPKNMTQSYKGASRLMQFTASVIAVLFLTITYQTVKLGLSGETKTSTWSEYVIYALLVVLTFGTLIYAIVTNKNKKG